MRVEFTAEARARLVEIEEHVGQDDPAAAERLVDRLVRAGSSLARFPNRGRAVPERPAGGLRELIVGSYRVVYRVAAKRVQILTVFEGHRSFPEEVP